MPHYTCESCGARLYSAARPANLIDPSCPTCGTSHLNERRAAGQRDLRQAIAEGNLLQAVAEHRRRQPEPVVAP